MTRSEKRLLLGIGALMALFVWLEATEPRPLDWSPSFSRDHAKPFGARLLFECLQDLFPEVRSPSEPAVVALAERLRTADVENEPVNHAFVNNTLRPDVTTADLMLQLVALGDHMLLAADRIEGPLADSLNLRMGSKHLTLQEDTSDIRFVGSPPIATGVFRYARGFPGAYFEGYDTARTRVLAVDGASHPVLLHMAWGLGRFTLCSAPMAFTNYHLTKGRNAVFAAGAFSTLPPRPLRWDEHYKAGRIEAATPLRYVLRQPALRWAWFLALALIALHLLVQARRQQRPIPIMAPPRNAVRDMLHTIGHLHWHKGEHALLARRMIAHFKDEVRARTYLRTLAHDEPTFAHLATKTGLPVGEVRARFDAIARREQAAHLDEKDVLALSNELHDFRNHLR